MHFWTLGTGVNVRLHFPLGTGVNVRLRVSLCSMHNRAIIASYEREGRMDLVRVPGPVDAEKVRKELERRLQRKPTSYELKRELRNQERHREKIAAYRKKQEEVKVAAEEGKLFVQGGVGGPGAKPVPLRRGTLALLQDHLTMDEKRQLMDDWLRIARETKSWRGIAEYINTLILYEEGRPKSQGGDNKQGDVFINTLIQIAREADGRGAIYGDDGGSSGGDVSGEWRILPGGDGGSVSEGDPDPGA